MRLPQLYEEYKSRGLVIITLMISGSASNWATRYGLNFPVLDDTALRQWSVYGYGQSPGAPLNVILDRNMTIRYKKGDYSEAEIVAEIKKYL